MLDMSIKVKKEKKKYIPRNNYLEIFSVESESLVNEKLLLCCHGWLLMPYWYNKNWTGTVAKDPKWFLISCQILPLFCGWSQ